MPEGAPVAASVPRAWAAASVPPTLAARAWATAASGPPAGISVGRADLTSAGRADRSQAGAIRITGMVATWAGAPPGLEPRPWQGRTITTITTTAPTTTARTRITAAAPTP